MSWPPPLNGQNRCVRDVTALIRSKFEVEMINGTKEITVRLDGPDESLYEGGVWRIRVSLPERYPFKSPSIGFINRIYHPNIDEGSGSVCLDVINQTWTPLYNLVNVFQMFLPQLMRYPNPADPLNSEAAQMMLKHRTHYEMKVKDYVRKYASLEMFLATSENGKSSANPIPKSSFGLTGRELCLGDDSDKNGGEMLGDSNPLDQETDDVEMNDDESDMSDFVPEDDGISEMDDIFEIDEDVADSFDQQLEDQANDNDDGDDDDFDIEETTPENEQTIADQGIPAPQQPPSTSPPSTSPNTHLE